MSLKVGIALRRRIGAALLMALPTPGIAAEAIPAGEVIHASGVATAQRAGEAARVLGPRDALHEGDVVSTGGKAFVVMQLRDGSRMTLRPDTVFGIEQFAHGQTEESALLRLFRGGMRAVTGLIAKRNSGGYRIASTVATIGIRGTDFDARLCADDCARELAAQRQARVAHEAAASVVARVAFQRGLLNATSSAGEIRAVVEGGPLFVGDTVQTDPGSYAVLAFRDESKVTLHGDTRFRIEEFSHDAPGQAESMVVRLIGGGMRVITGLVVRRNPTAFHVATSAANIGVRGSGLDVMCTGVCAAQGNMAPPARSGAPEAGDGLFVYAWQGVAEVRFDSRSLAVTEGRAAFFSNGAREPILLDAVPAFMRDNPVPRPDTIDVDHGRLFHAAAHDEAEGGLYLLVRDGHVTLERDGQLLELGNGESAFVDPPGLRMLRLQTPARVLELDPYPRPDRFDPNAPGATFQTVEPGTRGIRGTSQECEVR